MTLLVREVTSFKGRIPTHMLKFNMENMAALRQGLSLFSDDCSLVGDINFAVTAVWLK